MCLHPQVSIYKGRVTTKRREQPREENFVLDRNSHFALPDHAIVQPNLLRCCPFFWSFSSQARSGSQAIEGVERLCHLKIERIWNASPITAHWAYFPSGMRRPTLSKKFRRKVTWKLTCFSSPVSGLGSSHRRARGFAYWTTGTACRQNTLKRFGPALFLGSNS